MLTHPTHEALSALKLDGMAEAFAELITQDRGRSLDPVAWIGLMLDREQARRDTRRFQSRLRAANLRHGNACMEDVDYRTLPRPRPCPVPEPRRHRVARPAPLGPDHRALRRG